jgi:hypothetical protein
MSALAVEIGRLSIAIDGVSALVAEAAVAGLEGELRRRLAGLRGSLGAAAVPELRIGPLDLPPRVEAEALRELIARRLIEEVLRPQAPPNEPERA